ncbi:MAG: pantoate--beta-alanine ligase [Planctomycetes bacterium]|nr:pantoate--beta-alanine ligase [Planctomycetota bacterium]
MQTTTSINDTRSAVAAYRREGKTIGFVPTMGALHVGHTALIEAARGRCGVVVVSIFINPMQFGAGEDYAGYPRTPETDLEACRECGVDLLFAPTRDIMYPPDATTTVHVAGLTDGLCGAHRPGHFDGVATVVAKLLNIVMPDLAFFGEKDYQQLKVIERLVRNLDMPIEIVSCPTVREEDGLAVSSRNAYLSPIEREQAVSLSRSMRRAADAVANGTRDARALIELMEQHIKAAGPAEIDYIDIVDPETLEPVQTVRGSVRICMAVRIGPCRLIDTIAVDAVGADG